ncbi:F-box protein [Canna indica]|uniref:F-box protein n=1 Tax=Canna indica TaxID=4628 RepID=A0AAQ3JNY5_9LILI|nr:F-box protein [Canna indica]
METWSILSTDILLLILEKLPVPDVIRSSAVCSNWCSAVHNQHMQRRKLHHHQIPWLMYTPPSKEHHDYPNAANFFSLSENRSYTIRLPPAPVHGRHWVGSSRGWLVTADDRSELHLLNPITGAQIDLPSVTTLHEIDMLEDERMFLDGCPRYVLNVHGYEEFFVPEALCTIYTKVVLSSDPTDAGCTVAFLYSLPERYFQGLAFARVGDDRWGTLSKQEFTVEYDDVIFSNGDDDRFYTVTKEGTVEQWNLLGPNPVFKIVVQPQLQEPYGAMQKYLVETPSGDILLVRSRIRLELSQYRVDGERKFCVGFSFQVQRVVVDTGELKEVSDLGDHALFLGDSESLCISLADVPELLPNHVYYSNANIKLYRPVEERGRHFGVYSLRTHESVNINLAVDRYSSPVWVRPSLVQ